MRRGMMASALLLMGLCSSVYAQEYRFTYSKLYPPLKHNLDAEHSDVKVGLFFTNFATKQPCAIDKAWMEKEQHFENLSISDNGEVNIPLDSNLRSANPLLYVHTQQDARCDYSLVVLTKNPLQGTVDYAEIEQVTEQMTTMLGQLGGMFSSWFAPDVIGVTLEFKGNQVSHIPLSDGRFISVNKQGKALLKLSDLSQGVTAQLDVPTQRVMPYIQK
ncbi:DUF2987 domain-containing protein [Vibrio rarus]|uniref:DUF2987 domain-containing protein n=1 Tax=Vibrio rarus TaxID=413403 RepID=UPI0021C367B6|nr:DUF2987 domain-containing protein [Vibrio rarus]